MSEEEFKRILMMSGVALMVVACFVFLDIKPTAQNCLGTGMLFIIGLGMTIASSPDERKNK